MSLPRSIPPPIAAVISGSSNTFALIAIRSRKYPSRPGILLVPPEKYTPDTFDTTKGVVVRLDESDAEEIIKLLDGAGKSVSENSKLWSIISEEAEIYFAGAKDLDETVKVIQSRVSTYISERN